MKSVVALGGALALLFTAAASAETDPVAPEMNTPQYLRASAQTDEFEIQEGKLAESMAQRPLVKKLAEMMVRDHEQTTQSLDKAITADGMTVPPPPPLTADQAQMLATLQQSSGADFDRTYIAQQIAAHEQALAVQDSYSVTGKAPNIRTASLTTKTLVKQHLVAFQQLQRTMMSAQ